MSRVTCKRELIKRCFVKQKPLLNLMRVVADNEER